MLNDFYQRAGILGALVAASSTPAVATQFLTLAQAQHALFPQADAFLEYALSLSQSQQDQISALSGNDLPDTMPKFWKVISKGKAIGFFVTDDVIGKHENITYAVAISSEGKVLGMEVLEYRENHGGDVVKQSWREQFLGKRIADPIKLGSDIQNISGATLSCKHLTEGVRKILAIYDIAVQRLGQTT